MIWIYKNWGSAITESDRESKPKLYISKFRFYSFKHWVRFGNKITTHKGDKFCVESKRNLLDYLEISNQLIIKEIKIIHFRSISFKKVVFHATDFYKPCINKYNSVIYLMLTIITIIIYSVILKLTFFHTFNLIIFISCVSWHGRRKVSAVWRH